MMSVMPAANKNKLCETRVQFQLRKDFSIAVAGNENEYLVLPFLLLPTG